MSEMRPVAAGLAVTALLAGAVPAGDAAPRRSGKVVRVQRSAPQASTRLRLCQLYDIDVGACSREVKVGDVGWVVDAEGAYGQAQIVAVTPSTDACGTTTAWNISIDNSGLTSRDYSYNAVLVLDHPIAENGRTLPTSQEPPAGRAGELLSHIVDDDGDGQGDVLITTFPCDDRGAAAQAHRITHQCTDYWVEQRDTWRHARTDTMPTCRR